jgi:1-acyl-sn-glycerol-3-phosphate acyltransferase
MDYLRAALFYIGLALNTLVWTVLIILAWPLPYRIREALAKGWCHGVLASLRLAWGVSYRVEGLDHLPEQPAVLMANHESAWETIGLRAAIHRPMNWVLKEELLRIPLYGWALRALEEISIDRNAGRDALRKVENDGRDRLGKGRWVVIFPEGTRSAPGEVTKFGQGGSRLAVAAGAPIVPVAHNAGYYWPNEDWRKRRGTITVRIGAPIETQGRKAAEVNREVEAWITEQVQALA